MTNNLVGDVYAKIIEEVVGHSTTDFEESGVGSTTLKELQAEWQAKLSQRGVAQMPWDPKPQPPAQQQQQTQATPSALPSATANGLPQSYPSYDSSQAQAANGARIKTEPGTEQYNGLTNGNYQNGAANTQGGLARAQALVQQQYGNAASASINAMQQQQQQRGGLALPGQQSKPPQGLNLPAGSPQQQSFQQQQQAAMARQQHQLAQQQAEPRIKVESPQLQQGTFTQQSPPHPSYGQTDGADEGLDEWRAMLAERRAANARHGEQADRLMRDNVLGLSEQLQSGLMVPLGEQPSRPRKQKRHSPSAVASSSKLPSIPQLDGEDDDDDKAGLKDEDDENAINSDLDDSDDDNGGAMGDDDDDFGDTILCTYDKVQRVKNKWKCTLKDGVMSVNGKEWVFHKGTGEFEW